MIFFVNLKIAYGYVCVCVCIIEYYSVLKKDNVLTFAITWMDLHGIMLSEIRQLEKEKNYMISLMWNIKQKINK